MEHLLFNSCYRIETAKMYKLPKNSGMCVHLYNSYVIIWCPTLTLHVNQNAINLLHFQVPYPQFLSKAAGFLVYVLLKLSDYICSDGTNKYFFIIMHCGIIFSCMENFKEWPVFFLWLFMKVSWKGAAKEDRTYCHDLITVCCRCRF